METVTDFIFLGSIIIVDGDCSHEIKRCLLLGRKTMTNLASVLKSRDITLLIKVHIVRTMVFPIVMYRCESWTIKKAAWQRIDAFKLWCWRRLPPRSALRTVSVRITSNLCHSGYPYAISFPYSLTFLHVNGRVSVKKL